MTEKLLKKTGGIWKSIWLFPALLTIVLFALTVFRLNGSSIGSMWSYFYGAQKDRHVLFNKPETIRSDEWLVNTQMTIAQSANGYHRINTNIGNGEDMSISLDVPYKDWSQLFKPHNWAFFIMPFSNAFAFKWWVMGYLLIISCYFFVLALLPSKRLLAVFISLALFFSPFIQWWYQYITLGPIYYSLFIGLTVIYLMKAQRRIVKLSLCAALTFLIICFCLVLYPPFQIPCGIAMGAFLLAYIFESREKNPRPNFVKKLGLIGLSILISGLVVGLFFYTRSGVIRAVENTAYPGNRLVHSGGYNVEQLLSGEFDNQLLYAKKLANYKLPGIAANQSELSNFILLTPFLFIPSIYLLVVDWRKLKKIDWPLLATNFIFLVFILQMFLSSFEPISRVLLLNRVPNERLLIGLGLLNIIQLVVFLRNLSKKKSLPQYYVVAYVLAVFLVELWVAWYAKTHFEGFMSSEKAILYSLSVPAAVYLILRRRFVLGAFVFLAFCFYSSYKVNPVYYSNSVIAKNPVIASVKQISSNSNGKWITEGIYLENFPAMAGAPSLSGVYYYPQVNIWDKLGTNQSIYNRYAHVNFLTENSQPAESPKLQLLGPDHFEVLAGACSSFLQQENVKYILTTSKLNVGCLRKVDTIAMPGNTFYIYKIVDSGLV